MDNKPIEYRCRIALEPEDFNSALVQFLKAKDSKAFTERDKVYSAVAAYWMPFAMRNAGFTDDESKQSAKEAVYRLTLHIRYLAQSFGLELEEATPQLSSNSKSLPSLTKDEDFEDSIESLSTSESEDVSEPSIHHDDDSAFEEMFS
ncbi:hypothetical protein [Anabaena azotica]|uniref:Uncharacterized protein n=1 Tax=Anabaena azotica FACHB-119 TaxID=947527 RepID=A0ABR8DBP5_9NOST|nr:hypothetical protein [Anabaena azotica]MBD2503893.1 hypothetical protein [Anabaena azotica FACHB-119]